MEQTYRPEHINQKHSYWKKHIESWQETGLTQAEYCRRYNLKHHQLVYWKKRFTQTEEAISFVPLRLNALPSKPNQSENNGLCLVIKDHFKIEINYGFDVQLLRQLIVVLSELS
jgi:hypothetical protein